MRYIIIKKLTHFMPGNHHIKGFRTPLHPGIVLACQAIQELLSAGDFDLAKISKHVQVISGDIRLVDDKGYGVTYLDLPMKNEITERANEQKDITNIDMKGSTHAKMSKRYEKWAPILLIHRLDILKQIADAVVAEFEESMKKAMECVLQNNII